MGVGVEWGGGGRFGPADAPFQGRSTGASNQVDIRACSAATCSDFICQAFPVLLTFHLLSIYLPLSTVNRLFRDFDTRYESWHSAAASSISQWNCDC